MSRNENRFQASLIKELMETYPDSVVMKNDPNYIQGIPDLTILAFGKWAFLECKKFEDARRQANQAYYISFANTTGAYGAFIYPENKDEILDKLWKYFNSDICESYL